MIYDLAEHRHRFAVWAAARASQRGFTAATVEILRDALEATDIRGVLTTPATLQLQALDFETLHRRWCSSICSTLSQRQIAKVTYGRAAKLVAVYLKATVLMGEGCNTPFGQTMHPPIDRTLLQHLASSARVASPHKAEWRSVNWTHLTESAYYRLIGQLREVIPADRPFWVIEQHWQPVETEEDAL